MRSFLIVRRLLNGEEIFPPTGRKWVLQSGYLSHITGTQSLCLVTKKLGLLLNIAVIANVHANITLIMHSLPVVHDHETIAAVTHVSAWSPSGEIIVHDDEKVTFAGAATSYVNLLFKESDK